MTKAIVIHEFGGPEVLSWEEVDVPAPGPGEALLRQTAIGMNLMEVGLRMGTYPGPALPFIPGVESTGVVEPVGPGVSVVKPGDRVGCAGLPVGSYAEKRVFPADRLIPLPDDIPDETAAASMVAAMTADYLLKRTYKVGPGTKMLIHAAAGGTGLMVCQIAKHLGAEVMGTVSSEEKAEIARQNGCTHPIIYTRENFADRVLEITDGRGADVIYDSIGKDTFYESVRCLHRFGTLGLFGVASGLPEPLQLMTLDLLTEQKFTRPSFYAQVAEREDLLAIAENVFGYLRDGVLKVRVDRSMALRDAAEGHRAVESRQTVGSLVFVP